MTRADVHERFLAAAREMLSVEGIYTVRVSKILVDEQGGEWSEPVRFRFHPRADGTLDVIFERVEAAA